MAILSPMFLLLCVVAIRSEDTQAVDAVSSGLQPALRHARAPPSCTRRRRSNDAAATARWQRVIDEVVARQPEIAQIYLEDIKVADRCTTCHRGIDNPLFEDAPQPFRTHPGRAAEVPRHHPLRLYAVPQGQGVATTVEGAHGHEANWLTPCCRPRYVQTSCARCHEVTHGVKGAEGVSHGNDLFMEKGCYGCHDVQGRDLPAEVRAAADAAASRS